MRGELDLRWTTSWSFRISAAMGGASAMAARARSLETTAEEAIRGEQRYPGGRRSWAEEDMTVVPLVVGFGKMDWRR